MLVGHLQVLDGLRAVVKRGSLGGRLHLGVVVAGVAGVALLGVVGGLRAGRHLLYGVVEAEAEGLVDVGVVGRDGQHFVVVDFGGVGLSEVEVELRGALVVLHLLLLLDVGVGEDGEGALQGVGVVLLLGIDEVELAVHGYGLRGVLLLDFDVGGLDAVVASGGLVGVLHVGDDATVGIALHERRLEGIAGFLLVAHLLVGRSELHGREVVGVLDVKLLGLHVVLDGFVELAGLHGGIAGVGVVGQRLRRGQRGGSEQHRGEDDVLFSHCVSGF